VPRLQFVRGSAIWAARNSKLLGTSVTVALPRISQNAPHRMTTRPTDILREKRSCAAEPAVRLGPGCGRLTDYTLQNISVARDVERAIIPNSPDQQVDSCPWPIIADRSQPPPRSTPRFSRWKRSPDSRPTV